MFKNVVKYELKRSFIPFATLYAIAIVFSLIARMKWFTLTDMPLFYLVFFGATAILLFRFWSTMYGQEATFVFSIPLSAKKQVGMRLFCAFLFSIITTFIIAVAILIQGEAMAILLSELHLMSAVLLFVEISVSLFYLVLQLETVLTLSNLPFCREKRKLWIVIWVVVFFGVTSALSAFTEPFLEQYIVIAQSGAISFSTTSAIPLSFAFSLNTTLWMIIISPVCIWLIGYITEKYLQIA